MTNDQFWALVASSKAASGGTFDGYLQALVWRLSKLRPEEILDFQRIFDEYMDQAYSWDLWGAAYVIGGGCSDDGFTDFRSWLISLGREIYEQALVTPDSLAEVALGPGAEEDAFFEEFAYVASRAYEQKTGQEMTYCRRSHPSEPTGQRWAEHGPELSHRFPRLSAKYGKA